MSSLELRPQINEKKNCHIISISVSCFLHPVPEATGVEVEDVDNSVMKTIMAIKNVFIVKLREREGQRVDLGRSLKGQKSQR